MKLLNGLAATDMTQVSNTLAGQSLRWQCQVRSAAGAQVSHNISFHQHQHAECLEGIHTRASVTQKSDCKEATRHFFAKKITVSSVSL